MEILFISSLVQVILDLIDFKQGQKNCMVMLEHRSRNLIQRKPVTLLGTGVSRIWLTKIICIFTSIYPKMVLVWLDKFMPQVLCTLSVIFAFYFHDWSLCILLWWCKICIFRQHSISLISGLERLITRFFSCKPLTKNLVKINPKYFIAISYVCYCIFCP